MAGLRNNLREKLPARGAMPVCKGVKAYIPYIALNNPYIAFTVH